MTSDINNLNPISLAEEADFRLGNVEVRPSTRELRGPFGREVLEPRVMQVLVALARRRGETVSRDQLIVTCWEGRVVSEDAINRVLSRLRRLAEATGYTPADLETLSNAGVLDLVLATVEAGAPALEARNWWTGDIARRANETGSEPGDLGVSPTDVARLVALVAEGTLSTGLARQALDEEEGQHRGDNQEGAQRQHPLHQVHEARVAQRLQRGGADPRRPVISGHGRIALHHAHAIPAATQSWIWITPSGLGEPASSTNSWVIFFSVIRARASAASWSGRATLGLDVITSAALRWSMFFPA